VRDGDGEGKTAGYKCKPRFRDGIPLFRRISRGLKSGDKKAVPSDGAAATDQRSGFRLGGYEQGKESENDNTDDHCLVCASARSERLGAKLFQHTLKHCNPVGSCSSMQASDRVSAAFPVNSYRMAGFASQNSPSRWYQAIWAIF
jgi:hypothetical protein